MLAPKNDSRQNITRLIKLLIVLGYRNAGNIGRAIISLHLTIRSEKLIFTAGAKTKNYCRQITEFHKDGLVNCGCVQLFNLFLPWLGVEINSSLPLAVLCYFNIFYSMIWFICSLVLLVIKFTTQTLNFFASLVYIILFVCWCLTEPARLYLCYFGNLNEQVCYMYNGN